MDNLLFLYHGDSQTGSAFENVRDAGSDRESR